jgi:hypothetical protein
MTYSVIPVVTNDLKIFQSFLIVKVSYRGGKHGWTEVLGRVFFWKYSVVILLSTVLCFSYSPTKEDLQVG